MKKGYLVICLGTLCATTSLRAQNEADALRYSNLTFGGTARFMGMAGAFGALGGDISTLSYNPAGIAVYRKNEFTFTPSVFSRTTNSTYNGFASSDNKINFNISNIGLVGTVMNDADDGNGWVSANFGIGYSRTNNFHSNVFMQGDNKKNSMLDTYVASANGSTSANLDQYGSFLAYDAYLIDTVKGNPQTYYSAVPKGGVSQRKQIETSGAMGETAISFGGNYANKLYIGGTLGIPYIRYTEKSTYTEKDEKDTIHQVGSIPSGFSSFTLNQSLTTRSTFGLNFKFGVIYRATDWVRIGAAVHTPTYFSLSDEYSSDVASKFDDGTGYTSKSPTGNFDYNLTTPMRAIGSLGFIIQKKGIISMDYEYVDYTKARLGASMAGVFSDPNDAIHRKFTSASNIRVGGEVRLDPFAIRAGYAFYGSPLNLYPEGSRQSYTLGFGYKMESFYLDFAYVLTQSQEYYYFYYLTDTNGNSVVNAATNKIQSSAFMLTVGFRY